MYQQYCSQAFGAFREVQNATIGFKTSLSARVRGSGNIMKESGCTHHGAETRDARKLLPKKPASHHDSASGTYHTDRRRFCAKHGVWPRCSVPGAREESESGCHSINCRYALTTIYYVRHAEKYGFSILWTVIEVNYSTIAVCHLSGRDRHVVTVTVIPLFSLLLLESYPC